MNIFKKSKDNLLEDFMLDESEEREVLETFGKYHVFAPNKEVDSLILNILNDSIKEENKVTISETEKLIEVFKLCTDLPEEVLEISNFKKIQKRPKRIFTKMCEYIGLLLQDEIVKHAKTMESINNMPPKMREAMIRGANEATDTSIEITEYEQYKKLEKKYKKEKESE